MTAAALVLAALLIIPGVLLLVAGVSLYDAFIMLIGFVIGTVLAGTGLAGAGLADSTVGLAATITIALLFGFVAAFLALAAHHLLIVVLGFLGGAALGMALLHGIGVPATPTGGVAGVPATTENFVAIAAILLGGALGAALGWFLFRAIVILITAGIGAGLVSAGTATAFHDPAPVDVSGLPELALQNELLFLALFVIGVAIQAVQTLRRRRVERTRTTHAGSGRSLRV